MEGGREKKGLKIRTLAAVDRNMGIGYKGGMPWPMIRTDFDFMHRVSTETKTKGLQNAVVFGRKTWESVIRGDGVKWQNRFNIVLTRKSPEEVTPGADLVSSSLKEAMEKLNSPPLAHQIEVVYILGGGEVYKEAMSLEDCDILYVTEIEEEFSVDAYHPPIDPAIYQPIESDDVPQGRFTENGVSYTIKVYKRI